VTALARTQELAEQLGRPDLGAHLAQTRAELAGRSVPVAVIGEFKRGKSTLVNALLQTDVCPVDADIVTAVPTLVRFGDEASAVALVEDPADPRRTVEQPVSVHALAELVVEHLHPDRGGVRSVEVRLNRRLLRGGLCLVDTPGVGGLESAHGAVTLTALASADALIFVTDASQELTAAEVAFLRQALQRCPRAVCVVTKTDLYPQWRRMVALDAEHLRRAGIDIPVVAVSSFLRLRARSEPPEEKAALNEESGFRDLYAWLAGEVLEAANRQAVTAAAQQVEFAQQQLRDEVQTERLVLSDPKAAPDIVERLERDTRRRAALAASGANWQQALSFGIEDLVSDVQHDLAERLKNLARDAEAAIDENDPKETWEQLGTWLQKQVVTAVGANYDLMADRAAELAGDVADAFELEAGVPVQWPAPSRMEAAGGIGLAPLDNAGASGRTARLVFVGRTVAFVPMMTFGVAYSLGLIPVVGPLAVAVGVGLGRKLLRDERLRQLSYRRQQAKVAVRRYLDDVQFVVGKDCRDALAVTRRELLLEFQARAGLLQASAQRAHESAQRAAATPPQARAARAAQLEQQVRAIDRMGEALVPAAPAGAGRGAS
jgi:hypothetical protein